MKNVKFRGNSAVNTNTAENSAARYRGKNPNSAARNSAVRGNCEP